VWDKQQDSQVAELENRIAVLEGQLNTALGILALIRPAATVLASSGVDDTQQKALYDLIDEMESRVMAGFSVSYAEFAQRVGELVPARRGDRRFFEFLIEALKLERVGAKPMLDHLTNAMGLFRA
jgi:hypothetical protein